MVPAKPGSEAGTRVSIDGRDNANVFAKIKPSQTTLKLHLFGPRANRFYCDIMI